MFLMGCYNGLCLACLSSFKMKTFRQREHSTLMHLRRKDTPSAGQHNAPLLLKYHPLRRRTWNK